MICVGHDLNWCSWWWYVCSVYVGERMPPCGMPVLKKEGSSPVSAITERRDMGLYEVPLSMQGLPNLIGRWLPNNDWWLPNNDWWLPNNDWWLPNAARHEMVTFGG